MAVAIGISRPKGLNRCDCSKFTASPAGRTPFYMKYIPLTQGQSAIVDDEDFEYLNQFKWHAEKLHGTYYAARRVRASFRKYVIVKMHQVIVGRTAGLEIDHINGNGLDNRRFNLRLVTHQQNSQNSKLRTDNTSGYKGVGWSPQKNKWYAKIVKDGKQIHVGFFDDPVLAAKAYDRKARELFGESARTNF